MLNGFSCRKDRKSQAATKRANKWQCKSKMASTTRSGASNNNVNPFLKTFIVQSGVNKNAPKNKYKYKDETDGDTHTDTRIHAQYGSVEN